MGLAGYAAREVARSAIRAQAKPAPARHPGTVAVPQRADVAPSAVLPPGQGPKPQPIDGVLLWCLLRKYLEHYVAFRSEAQATLVTAWLFHAMARDRDSNGIGQLIWRASPRLLVTSANRGSGKSTLLDLIVIITQSRRGKVPKITPARIAQVLGKHFETVVLDEAKTILGSGSKSLELQGIMLAGYTRRTSYEISGVSYSLFGALAWAGKDELITDTKGTQIGDLLDRSLTVRLDPPARAKPEVAERAEDDGDLLARALVAWTDSVRAELKQAAREISDEDLDAAEEAADRGEKMAPGKLRAIQISRPLRACARVVGPVAEADIVAALDELTAGAAGTQTADIMTQLQKRSEAWGGTTEDDEPGRIVTSDDEDDDDAWTAQAPQIDPADPDPDPAAGPADWRAAEMAEALNADAADNHSTQIWED
jgi:hypothetical protein